jgi:hypothetical protein
MVHVPLTKRRENPGLPRSTSGGGGRRAHEC